METQLPSGQLSATTSPRSSGSFLVAGPCVVLERCSVPRLGVLFLLFFHGVSSPKGLLGSLFLVAGLGLSKIQCLLACFLRSGILALVILRCSVLKKGLVCACYIPPSSSPQGANKMGSFLVKTCCFCSAFSWVFFLKLAHPLNLSKVSSNLVANLKAFALMLTQDLSRTRPIIFPPKVV